MHSLVDNVDVIQAFPAESRATTTDLYNNAASGGTNGIDVSKYREVMVVCNFGQFQGATDLTISLVSSDTDDSSTASAVTGATFQTTGETDEVASFKASAKTKDMDRYMWVKSVSADATANLYSVDCIFNQNVINPLPGAVAEKFKV